MKKLALIFGLLLSMNANATGGFWCSYDDGSLKLDVSGVTSHGFQAAIVDASASLTGAAHHDFLKSDFSQYWNNDGEFRLALYAETETLDRVTTVIIKTKVQPDEFTFKGTLSIGQNGTALVTDAPIECSLE